MPIEVNENLIIIDRNPNNLKRTLLKLIGTNGILIKL